MATYSPELLAALRHRYEQTDQPMNALAADFGIGITTLQTLVRKNGWTQRSKRLRDCPSALRLLHEAEALAAPLPPPERGRSDCEAVRVGVNPETAPVVEETPTPTLPLSGGGSPAAPAESAMHALDTTVQMPGPVGVAPTLQHLSPVERLEALVEKEIAAEEAARAELGVRPRARHEAERCARTLSVLTQTLKTLQGMRGGGGAGAYEYDDTPEDIDAFREQLAKRIHGFIESRIGPERMALNEQCAALTDDELKELMEVGRERGMQALLRPPEDEADDLDERDRAHAAQPQGS